MNEFTRTQLMIVVERAVRPVRASMSRKRKMREELLAHVLGVFEEESARLSDERAALERTASRFGNPAEVTSELQQSVPTSDGIKRFWEGRPGEPVWRTAFRIAWVTGALALTLAGFEALLFGGEPSSWPGEVFVLLFQPVLALPVYLAGLVFQTDWTEKALYGPKRRSWVNVALVSVGSLLFILLWSVAVAWPTGPTWPAEWGYLCALLIVGFVAWPGLTYGLARSSVRRKRYDAEWARLDIT